MAWWHADVQGDVQGDSWPGGLLMYSESHIQTCVHIRVLMRYLIMI